MIVVSDTSAISAFLLIEQLELLPQLYGRVIVPPSVMAELLLLESRYGHDLSSLDADWLEVIPISNTELFKQYLTVLDLGESEALVLTQELQADLLLIDEMKGRKVAEAAGIAYTGVLGVLLSAKSKRLIESIRPLLDALIKKAGFRMSPALMEFVLEQANELHK